MEPVSGYTEEERRVLRQAIGAGTPLSCPICAGDLTVSDVAPRGDVPYVRHRGWVRCPTCRRTTTLDLPPATNDDDTR